MLLLEEEMRGNKATIQSSPYDLFYIVSVQYMNLEARMYHRALQFPRFSSGIFRN